MAETSDDRPIQPRPRSALVRVAHGSQAGPSTHGSSAGAQRRPRGAESTMRASVVRFGEHRAQSTDFFAGVPVGLRLPTGNHRGEGARQRPIGEDACRAPQRPYRGECHDEGHRKHGDGQGRVEQLTKSWTIPTTVSHMTAMTATAPTRLSAVPCARRTATNAPSRQATTAPIAANV